MDVIEQGPQRDSPPRRTRALAVLALGLSGAALLVRAVVDAGGGDHPSRQVVPPSPGPTLPHTSSAPARRAVGATGSPTAPATQRHWPERAAACGGTTLLPRLAVRPLSQRTGLNVLVGGPGLYKVSVDTGVVVRVAGTVVAPGTPVTAVLRNRRSFYLLAQRCSQVSATSQALVRLSADLRRSLPARLRQADGLVPGSTGAPAWTVRYPTDPGGALDVRTLPTGMRVHLPTDFSPTASTPVGLVGTTATDPTGDAPPLVEVVTPSGHVSRRLGRGDLLAATGRTVLLADRCVAPLAPRARCEVLVGRPDGSALHRIALPVGRAIVSAAVLSPDGAQAAFQLSRAKPDTAYEAEHPFPSADLAVLHLPTGRLQVLRGVELPPKYAAGLAFSADNRWLLIGLNEGNGARVLVWREAWAAPRLSPAVVRGPVLYDVPILDLASAGD